MTAPAHQLPDRRCVVARRLARLQRTPRGCRQAAIFRSFRLFNLRANTSRVAREAGTSTPELLALETILKFRAARRSGLEAPELYAEAAGLVESLPLRCRRDWRRLLRGMTKAACAA